MNIKYDANGLVAAITQDYITGEVLIFAYMNAEAYDKTVETGIVHYYSRSRKALWKKGETSGNFQYVKTISYDCDCDALLISVIQTGVACHTGNKSCFYRALDGKPAHGNILNKLYDIVDHKSEKPENGSEINRLLDDGAEKLAESVLTAAEKTSAAAKDENKTELINETADLIYYLTVLLNEKKITWDEIYQELYERMINKNNIYGTNYEKMEK